MPRPVTGAQLRRRLATNVFHLRHAAGLTIEVAAERASVATRQWDRLEAGTVNTTLNTLVRVARALGVDPGALLAASEPPPTPPSTNE